MEIKETKSLIIETNGNITFIYKKKDYLKGKLHKPIRIIREPGW